MRSDSSGSFVVPKTIDSGASGELTTAIFIDLTLLSVFAVQHSVMARPVFKRVVDADHSSGNGAKYLRPGQQPRSDPLVLAMATVTERRLARYSSIVGERSLDGLRGRLVDRCRLNISD